MRTILLFLAFATPVSADWYIWSSDGNTTWRADRTRSSYSVQWWTAPPARYQDRRAQWDYYRPYDYPPARYFGDTYRRR